MTLIVCSNTMKGMISARLAQTASEIKSSGYIGLQSQDEFNDTAKHISDLIRSAYILFTNRFYGPCVFISITSFEELAKVKAGHMRSWNKGIPVVKRSKDPLFNHSDKHKIAVDPILLIGKRLKSSLGRDRVESIFQKYETGEYSHLRETSLYFSRDQQGLKLPSTEISGKLAAEHLLLAIEMFDDYLDFMTEEVYLLCRDLNQIYSEIATRIAKIEQTDAANQRSAGA